MPLGTRLFPQGAGQRRTTPLPHGSAVIHLHKYIYIYIHTYIHTCIYMCIYIYTLLFVPGRLLVRSLACSCIFERMPDSISINLSLSLSLSMYTYAYIYIYIERERVI